MLVHNQRADMLKNAIARQASSTPPPRDPQGAARAVPPELFAEDLVRGYRIDVWDDVSNRWHSLCQREASYDIDGGAVDHRRTGGGRDGTAGGDHVARSGEQSRHHLAARDARGVAGLEPLRARTGQDDRATTTNDHSDPVTDAEPEVPPGLRLKSAFKALPGSLPRLRYGRQLLAPRPRRGSRGQFAAVSMPKDFGPEQSKKNARPYFRYEPISAPAIALVKPTPATIDAPAEGESMERLAVRSFNDTPPLKPCRRRNARAASRCRAAPRNAKPSSTECSTSAASSIPRSSRCSRSKDNSLAEEKLSTAGPLPGGAPVETGYAVDGRWRCTAVSAGSARGRDRGAHFRSSGFSRREDHLDPALRRHEVAGRASPSKSKSTTTRRHAALRRGRADAFHSASESGALHACGSASSRDADALNILGVWNWLTPAQQTQTIVINGHQRRSKNSRCAASTGC